MGYPQQPGYGQQQYGGQTATPDPWANGNLPTGAYDGSDPFDNAIPDSRGQRAQLADPRTGLPVIHTDGQPVFVSAPSLRTLGIGALLIIVPKKIERDIKNTRPGAWKPTFNRLTADVIVCEGQGRMFGGDPTRGLDDPIGPYPVPCVIEDMWIDKDGIIERVEKVLGTGFKIGRIAKVKTSNDRTAWNFNAPHEDPAIATQIVQSLRPLWQAYTQQQLPILNLKTLAERYGVKPGTAAAQPAQQFTNLTNPAYAGGSTVPLMPNGGAVMPPATWPPIQQGYPQNMPTQPVSAPQAPVQDWTLTVTLPPALASFSAMWPTLTREQREQMLANAGVPNPNTAGGSIPPMQTQQAGPGQPPPF